MGTIASQMTSLTIVYSSVYSGADQRKHQSSASLVFVWGLHRRPVNSPHKGPVTRKNASIWWRHHVEAVLLTNQKTDFNFIAATRGSVDGSPVCPSVWLPQDFNHVLFIGSSQNLHQTFILWLWHVRFQVKRTKVKVTRVVQNLYSVRCIVSYPFDRLASFFAQLLTMRFRFNRGDIHILFIFNRFYWIPVAFLAL